MNVLNYSLRFRPLRIGWCLRQNDWDAYREILHLNFILAGGQFNPLIPIDDEDYARALIRTFRVDLLLCFPDNEKIHAFIAKFPHLTAPHMHRTFWENLYGSRIPPYVDISHPIRKYFGQASKNSPDYKLQCYSWEDSDPLAHVMLATWGKLREPSTQEFNYLELLAQSVSIQSTALTSDDPFPVPSGDPYLYIPSQLCRLGVEQHYRHSNRLRHAGLYLGYADNFQDLVNFWNLKATDLPIAFYDPSHADRLRERKQNWLSFFPPFRKQTALNPAPMVLWGQTSEILIESGKWEIPVDRRVVNAVSWNGANIKVPYMYFSEHPVIGIQSASLSGNPKISIQRPPPHPFDNEVLTQGQRMVVAIQPQSANLIDHTATLQLPFIPHLNSYYDRSCHFGIGLACTRIEPDGIGFIQEIYDQNLSIAPVNVVELICKLFALHGIKADLSDAGLTTQRLIHQMGGLQHCRFFKIRGVRKLIKQFGPTREFTWGSAAAFIRDMDEQTKKCSLDNYSHVYINGKKLDADGIMETFLDKRVFSAGLKLSCPNCLLEFWAANRLPAPQTCEFCQHEFNILPFLKKNGAWHFRPSGLFAKGNDPKKGGDQKGAIPTILTLQQLEHCLGWGEMPYCASMNFEKIISPHWKCESDFVAIRKPNNEGKTELVIGECKSEGGEITDEDVTKLGMLADVLPEDHFHVYIVFSKLSHFTSEELHRIASLNAKSTRAIIFTTGDLEALRPYEELLQKHAQSGFSAKLQDMAEITRAFILQNPRATYPAPSDTYDDNVPDELKNQKTKQDNALHDSTNDLSLIQTNK